MTQPADGDRPLVDELTLNVLAFVESGLDLGVTLTRRIAELAAGDRPVPPAKVDGAIPAIIHYALAATREVAALTPFLPARTAAAPAGTAPGTAAGAADAAKPAAIPSVLPGETLRVPLSIENPGAAPMADLRPTLRWQTRDGADASSAALANHVEFSPPRLTVAPRDFEKLVVLIAVPAEAPAGRCGIGFRLREDDPDIVVSFNVLPPTRG